MHGLSLTHETERESSLFMAVENATSYGLLHRTTGATIFARLGMNTRMPSQGECIYQLVHPGPLLLPRRETVSVMPRLKVFCETVGCLSLKLCIGKYFCSFITYTSTLCWVCSCTPSDQPGETTLVSSRSSGRDILCNLPGCQQWR